MTTMLFRRLYKNYEILMLKVEHSFWINRSTIECITNLKIEDGIKQLQELYPNNERVVHQVDFPYVDVTYHRVEPTSDMHFVHQSELFNLPSECSNFVFWCLNSTAILRDLCISIVKQETIRLDQQMRQVDSQIEQVQTLKREYDARVIEVNRQIARLQESIDLIEEYLYEMDRETTSNITTTISYYI